MKKRRTWLLLLTAALLLGFGFFRQPSKRSTLALLARCQSQMEDFVQLVKAEATQPHVLTPPPELSQYASPEGTHYSAVVTREGLLYGIPADTDLYDDQLLSQDLQDAWTTLSGGHSGFTNFSCTVAENGTVSAVFHREGPWRNDGGGHSRVCHALVWQDTDFPDPPVSGWQPLTEQNGLTLSPQGRWSYTSETHYDG